jgi:hypothetical protein
MWATTGPFDMILSNVCELHPWFYNLDLYDVSYECCKVHTTREYAHLPFDRTFTPDYPELLSSHDLARGYRKWATKYGIVS